MCTSCSTCAGIQCTHIHESLCRKFRHSVEKLHVVRDAERTAILNRRKHTCIMQCWRCTCSRFCFSTVGTEAAGGPQEKEAISHGFWRGCELEDGPGCVCTCLRIPCTHNWQNAQKDTYVHMHIHVYIHVYIHAHIHAYIHMHMQIQRKYKRTCKFTHIHRSAHSIARRIVVA